MAARELDVAVGADEQQRASGKLARDELEQEQRSLVRPVQVVQDEHERPGATRSLQEARDRVEEAKAGLLGIGASRRDSAASGSCWRTSGTSSATSAAPAPSSARSCSGPRSRTQERSACTHGQYGGAPPASQQRPQSTSAPLSTRPGSPAPLRDGSCRCPARRRRPGAARGRRALPSAPRSAASSRSRPTKTSRPAGLEAESTLGGRCGPRLTGGRGRIERGVLTEDRLLELHERRGSARGRALDQHAPRVLVDLQRLGLAVAAVQGEHQLPAQPLAQRVTGDQGLELGDEITVAPEGEVCFDPFLEGGQAQLLEPGDLVLGERVEGEVGERRAAPEAERLTEECRCLERSARRRAPLALCASSAVEAVRVELSVLEPEDVPGRPGQQDAAVAALPDRPAARPRRRAPCEAVRRSPGRSSARLRGPARPRARRSGDRSRPPRSHATEAQPGECVASLPRAPACGPAARSPADRGRETPSTPRFELGPEPNTNASRRHDVGRASTRSLPGCTGSPPAAPILPATG